MKAEISGLFPGPGGRRPVHPGAPDGACAPVPGHAEEARVAGTVRAVAYCRRYA